MKYLHLLLWLPALSGCADNRLEQRVCQDPAGLVQLVSNSSFYRRGESRFLLFYTFQGAKANEYFVEIRPQGDTLRKVQLAYPPSRALSPRYAAGTLHALCRQLDSLGIKEYVGVPDGLGVLLSLHLSNGRVLYQALDTTRITYAPTRAYIRQSTPLCQNWYRSEH
jgi:hypothetical protein